MSVISCVKPQSISHWYDRDGNPCYEVERVGGGGMRKSTIRDARKYKWFPSVSSVLKIVDKPFLNAWIANLAIEACLRVSAEKYDEAASSPMMDPGTVLLTEEDLPRIKKLADEVSKTARDKGKRYHREFERVVRQLADPLDNNNVYSEVLPPETMKAFILLYNAKKLKARYVEHSFTNKKYGFGGRLDWAGVGVIRPKSDRRRFTVLDYKTQDTKGKGKFTVYPEVPCQLAAYAYGIGRPAADLGTIFFDTSIPGNVELIYHPDNDDYFYAFLEAFRVWKGPLGKNYEV